MSEDKQNNASQAVPVVAVSDLTSTNATAPTASSQPIIDFTSPIYRNPDYGNISQKSFVVYNSKDSDKSK